MIKTAVAIEGVQPILIGMAESDSERVSFQVSRGMLKRFRAACEAAPLQRSMYDVANGVLGWWVHQPVAFQIATINGVPQGMELVFADALNEMAREYRQRDAARRGEPGPPRSFPEQLLADIAAENGVSPALAHSIVVSYFMGLAGPRNPPERDPKIVIEGPMPPANPKPPPAAAAPQRRRR